LKKKKKNKKNDKELSEHDKKKMRLWEAVFQDEFREAFYEYNNCLSRLELDGRKQKGSKDDRFLELVTKKHNDPEWLPQSQPVYGYHSRLNVSHVLPLHATYEVKDVRKLYTSMKGIFNKMLSNYKRSGNGSLNLQDSHHHSESSKSKSTKEEVFVDDNDKATFLMGKVHHGYFWALAEENQLSSTVSQNCQKIGISSSGSESISTTSSSSYSKKKERKMNIEDKTYLMINQVVGLREEMATINADRALHLLKVELRETKQQLNDQ
jgi:hypothetical protein